MEIQSAPVVIKTIPEGFTLTFKGPIHTNVSWLERELEQVIKAKPKQVRLDMTDSEYISSMGLGILTGLHNRIKANGGVVIIAAIKKRTMSILKIAYLDKLFQVAPNAVVDA